MLKANYVYLDGLHKKQYLDVLWKLIEQSRCYKMEVSSNIQETYENLLEELK